MRVRACTRTCTFGAREHECTYTYLCNVHNFMTQLRNMLRQHSDILKCIAKESG